MPWILCYLGAKPTRASAEPWTLHHDDDPTNGRSITHRYAKPSLKGKTHAVRLRTTRREWLMRNNIARTSPEPSTKSPLYDLPSLCSSMHNSWLLSLSCTNTPRGTPLSKLNSWSPWSHGNNDITIMLLFRLNVVVKEAHHIRTVARGVPKGASPSCG